MKLIPKVLVPLADGFEDIEALTVVDVLRRAGVFVVTAGYPGNIIMSKNRIRVFSDERLIDMEDFSRFDGIILSGGAQSVESFIKNERFLKIVDYFGKQGKFIAASSTAPLILVKLGLLKGKKATILSGLEKHLESPRQGPVVVDGNVVTASAPGNSLDFSLKIVEELLGRQKTLKLKEELGL